MDSKYKVSEIFYSPQGEGRYTGQLTAWVRSFACNLQCNGFGQKDPTDPSTYILPYQTFDVSSIKHIEDLPVFDYGCDSSYSWSAKFKNLCPSYTAQEIANKVLGQLPEKSLWQLRGRNLIHLAFTGGEPLLPKGQRMIEEVIRKMHLMGEFPGKVTVETNGTQSLSSQLENLIATHYSWYSQHEEFFMSISPKLFTVSGEARKDAINEEAIRSYSKVCPHGQLKFVVSNDDKAWAEMEEVISIFRDNGNMYPIYVMPVGATAEQQGTEHIKEIAYKAMDRGYNIAARVHTYIFGNMIGS